MEAILRFGRGFAPPDSFQVSEASCVSFRLTRFARLDDVFDSTLKRREFVVDPNSPLGHATSRLLHCVQKPELDFVHHS